jgi:hypothetical protein
MGGSRTRIVALLLIAFVALGAQCVASCSLESLTQPPCHKSPEPSCSHDQAVSIDTKIVKVELAAVAIVPAAIQRLPLEPSATLSCRPEPSPPSYDTVSSTVLRI